MAMLFLESTTSACRLVLRPNALSFWRVGSMVSEAAQSYKLAVVSPAKLQKWKRSFLAKAGSDALALRKARTVVNSSDFHVAKLAHTAFSPHPRSHGNASLCGYPQLCHCRARVIRQD